MSAAELEKRIAKGLARLPRKERPYLIWVINRLLDLLDAQRAGTLSAADQAALDALNVFGEESRSEEEKSAAHVVLRDQWRKSDGSRAS